MSNSAVHLSPSPSPSRMTRRDFGAGLAVLIATGAASAAGLRRGLAARIATGAAGGAAKPTAADFTQDGIICQFNGIEIGASPSVFEDLAAGHHYNCTNGITKSDDYVTANSILNRWYEVVSGPITDAIMGGAVTLESAFWCGDGNDAGQWLTLFKTQTNSLSIYGNGGASKPVNAINIYALGATIETKLRMNAWHYLSVKIDGGTISVRVNGGTEQTATVAANPTRGWLWLFGNYGGEATRVADFRFYGKALSEAERAANYATAKAMFPNYVG